MVSKEAEVDALRRSNLTVYASKVPVVIEADYVQAGDFKLHVQNVSLK